MAAEWKNGRVQPAGEWEIETVPSAKISKWHWKLYRNGAKVDDGYTATKWGARIEARRSKEKFLRTEQRKRLNLGERKTI